MKEGEDKIRFVKETYEPTKQFIFQKNKKTILGAIFIVIVFILIMGAIVLSGTVIENGQ